jgi:hypothetical protein
MSLLQTSQSPIATYDGITCYNRGQSFPRLNRLIQDTAKYDCPATDMRMVLATDSPQPGRRLSGADRVMQGFEHEWLGHLFGHRAGRAVAQTRHGHRTPRRHLAPVPRCRRDLSRAGVVDAPNISSIPLFTAAPHGPRRLPSSLAPVDIAQIETQPPL